MINLNAGNLWDSEYLNAVISLNKEFKETVQVKCLFGSISGLTPTARSADRIPYRDWDFIINYVGRAAENEIAMRYTLNQSCIGSIQDFRNDWDSSLGNVLIRLHNAGIREWTVTSPLLIQLLRVLFPLDFIEISTIAEISTPEEARLWKDLGADGVNISTSINRDFEALQQLAATGLTVSILANEACLYRCPWRRECYNLSSHNSLRSEELFGFYPFRNCNEARLAHPVEWIKSRLVLPQWMSAYQKIPGLDWFKIAYRTHPKEVALPMLRAYMEQQFNSNLCDLWPTISHLGSTPEPREITNISCKELDSRNFLEYFVRYGKNCKDQICGETCDYCDATYKKVMVK